MAQATLGKHALNGLLKNSLRYSLHKNIACCKRLKDFHVDLAWQQLQALVRGFLPLTALMFAGFSPSCWHNSFSAISEFDIITQRLCQLNCGVWHLACDAAGVNMHMM